MDGSGTGRGIDGAGPAATRGQTTEAAGGGAERQAERLAGQVEQARAALHEAQTHLVRVQSQQRAWAAGAAGERSTAQELTALPAPWLVLHDVHWPGRQRANLDHVVIGPGGLVVVDSKNWSVHAEVRGGVLRAGGYRKSRECGAVAQMVAAVAATLYPQHRTLVRGAVSLVQQDLLPVVAEAGTTVVGRRQLVGWLLSLPPVLDGDDVVVLHGILAATLGAARSPSQLTTSALDAAPAAPAAATSSRGGRGAGARAGAPPPPPRPRRGRGRPAVDPSRAAAARPVRRRRRGAAGVLVRVAVLVAVVATAPTWAPQVTAAGGELVAAWITEVAAVSPPSPVP